MTLTVTCCLGISHQTAPVALREAINTDPEALEWVLAQNEELQQSIHEWVVLSTCNRFELYVQIADTNEDAEQRLLQWWQQSRPFNLAELRPRFYFYRADLAARHLLSVATGLDSQVLGESQILGQVANALAIAEENRSVGLHLRTLFQIAVRAGKRGRTETAISNHPSSISSVAVAHIEAANGPLPDQSILVVGAGEMAQLALNALRKRGANQLAMVNRTIERAAEMVGNEGGSAFPFHQLPALLASVDAVISATGAPHTIIPQELVAEVMQNRPDRPLTLVDIAVPRDIEPAVGTIPGVLLINMDDLHDQLETARLAREKEVPAVEEILREELIAWQTAQHELQVRPVIRELRCKAETIRQRELERTLKHLGEVDTDTRKHIHHLSRALVNQLLHEPTINLRRKAKDGEAADLATAIQNLFNLPT